MTTSTTSSTTSSMLSINLNVAIIGHVDSGKTTLSKLLSDMGSTASFDKSPAEASRGITLDLGFSTFLSSTPNSTSPPLRFTVCDCPGHSSLIRQVLSCRSIVDAVVLVVSAVEGVQAQTVECLVIADTVLKGPSPHARGLVVISKVDCSPCCLPGTPRWDEVTSEVRDLVKGTNMEGCEIVPWSAREASKYGEGVKEGIRSSVNVGNVMRSREGGRDRDLYFMIDHSFAIRGVGTVCTGTVVEGEVKVGDEVWFPRFRKACKVKSIQSFKEQVSCITTGDRAGICVSGLDAKQLERGVCVGTGSGVVTVKEACALVSRVRMFNLLPMKPGKFHVTVGNETVMARAAFFGSRELGKKPGGELWDTEDYETQDHYIDGDGGGEGVQEGEGEGQGSGGGSEGSIQPQWALLTFDRPVVCRRTERVIGSRLDTEEKCRLAWEGEIRETWDGKGKGKGIEDRLVFYTIKEKRCKVDKVGEGWKRESDGKTVWFEVIAKNLFGKGAAMGDFKGLKLLSPEGDVGVLQGAFGTEGKFRVSFPGGTQVGEGGELLLKFKRIKGDKTNKMEQGFIEVPERAAGERIKVEGEDEKVGKKGKKGVDAPPPPPTSKVDTDRVGEVEKDKGDGIFIVSSLFTASDNVKLFVDEKVEKVGGGGDGRVVAAFGKAGKCKVRFEDGSVSVGDKVKLMGK
ncbi:hypothetical protein TrCOL_g5982 [Triparma columacea]|uniref:Elongation factor Tu, chloroplastic n=1 Tax=Triparma columacea TaxID=722753 RepID=A0A9W7GNC7_9STRA|nr:hypothetical protein TrCOL_g5982 [Triparma columacea]